MQKQVLGQSQNWSNNQFFHEKRTKKLVSIPKNLLLTHKLTTWKIVAEVLPKNPELLYQRLKIFNQMIFSPKKTFLVTKNSSGHVERHFSNPGGNVFVKLRKLFSQIWKIAIQLNISSNWCVSSKSFNKHVEWNLTNEPKFFSLNVPSHSA